MVDGEGCGRAGSWTRPRRGSGDWGGPEPFWADQAVANEGRLKGEQARWASREGLEACGCGTRRQSGKASRKRFSPCARVRRRVRRRGWNARARLSQARVVQASLLRGKGRAARREAGGGCGRWSGRPLWRERQAINGANEACSSIGRVREEEGGKGERDSKDPVRGVGRECD